MRNIVLQAVRRSQLLEDKDIDHVVFDDIGMRAYILTKARNFLQITFDKKTKEIMHVETKHLADEILPEQELVNMILHRFNNSIILVHKDGTISQIHLGQFEFEIIGEQEHGFLAAELSPCEELLVLASGNNSLILFDKEFNLVDEKPLDDGEGTGTDPKIDQCKIYFQVLYGNAKDGMKALTKDKYLATFKSVSKADPEGGEVRSICERMYPGVDSVLAWMPNGSLVMGSETYTAKGSVKKRIILWEKNGLRHGEFDLYSSHHETKDELAVTVHSMKWNVNSKAVAIEISEDDQFYILIYSRSNYRWYLKNKIPTKSKCSTIVWNSRKKYDLLYVSDSGEFVFLTLKHDFSVGTYEATVSNKVVQYTALACVIDGSVVNCTPLSKYCTPPPMSHFQIPFNGQVVDLSFSAGVVCALVMKDGKYLIDAVKYLWDEGVVGDRLAVVDLDIGAEFPRLPHVHVTTENEVKVFFATDTGKSTKLYEIGCTGNTINSSKCYPQEHGVALNWIKTSESASTVHYFGYNNELVYSQDGITTVQLPTQVFNIAKIFNFPGKNGVMHMAFLTEGSQLYIDTEIIAENCTSLAYHGDFFMFTVMTQNMFDMLFLYPVKDLAKAKAAVARQIKSSTGKDHTIRNVERGSDIISISGQRLVMEMPRGNLEVIYPKLLLFYEIQRLIVTEKNYMTAYKEIRRHKLDMNLIVDVSPKTFEEEVKNGNFLKTFRKTDDINLILNSLEKDVASDLSYIYSLEELDEIKKFIEVFSRPHEDNKVNYVCSLLRESMTKEQDFYILSIIMTYTRQQPAKLEAALELVQQLQKEEDELCDVIAAPHLNPQSRCI